MRQERVITVETGGAEDARVYQVNVAKLNWAGTTEKGQVEFDDDSVKEMVEQIETWDDERKNVYPYYKERYEAAKELKERIEALIEGAKAANERAALLGYKWRMEVPRPLGDTIDFEDWGGDEFPSKAWDQYKLGLLASQIEEAPEPSRRRQARRQQTDLGKVVWGGPVTELILELCEQLKLGEPPTD